MSTGLHDSAAAVHLGVDVGGTWIRCGVVDASGRLDGFGRVATPVGARAQYEALVDLCRQALTGRQVLGAGIAVPGIVRGGRLTSAGNHELPHDVGPRVQDALGLPVVLCNDAHAAALFEGRLGVGAGVEHLLFVNVGTGIGGAVVEGGRVLRGGGSAGEIGHMTLQAGGPPCSCGASGCWEALASGGSLERAAAALVPAALGGTAAGAASVDELCGAGDGRARALVAGVVTALSQGLASLAAVLDPEAIVLAGGLALDPHVRAAVERGFPEHRRPWTRAVLLFSEAGGTSGVRGAAMLAAESPDRA